MNSQCKSNCQINLTFPLERLGIEKTRVETGAATNVRSNDPTKRPGRFPSPNEIAPSSRNGSTTKYALKICKVEKLVTHFQQQEFITLLIDDGLTKKNDEVEQINADVSWGWTVTNIDMNDSIRDLSIIIVIQRGDFKKKDEFHGLKGRYYDVFVDGRTKEILRPLPESESKVNMSVQFGKCLIPVLGPQLVLIYILTP